MPEVKFKALVREVKAKALVSLDKGFSFMAQGEDENIKRLMDAPADQECLWTVSWDEKL